MDTKLPEFPFVILKERLAEHRHLHIIKYDLTAHTATSQKFNHIRPFLFSAMHCDFDQSMCGFVQDKNDTFDWLRNYGKSRSHERDERMGFSLVVL